MEETLSKMTVQKMQIEDDFHDKMKIEQEKADKYRAKYESVKQHVKTLEMQKTEYTRVNTQLREQNNSFRSMITQLQQQIKNGNNNNNNMNKPNNGPPNGIKADDDNNNNNPGIGPFGQRGPPQGVNGGGGGGGPGRSSMNGQRGRGIQRGRGGMPMRGGGGGPMGRGGQMIRGRGGMPMRGGPMIRGRGGMPIGRGGQMIRGRGGMPMGRGGIIRGRGGMQMGRGRGGGGGHMPANSVPNMNDKKNMGQGGPNHVHNRSEIPQGHQQQQRQPKELWGKRTKTISEKGNKKRVLVEWHFVTRDNQPHTVVLQHTQDNKPKTRRMLWVDGSEKYNNKSSASSFRIEIDKDVVVVSIELVNSQQYQYRLNINAMNYTDAFEAWKGRQQK